MNRFVLIALVLFSPLTVSAEEAIHVTLGGDVGAAADASFKRFSAAPYDSLPWLRADLTGERVSKFDGRWGHIMNRPFKNYSGDISGRFIEIMALNSGGSRDVHPALKPLLADLSTHQRAGGYFAASGKIDWQKPIDSKGNDWGKMTPALWGNARMLCALVEANQVFDDKALLAAATQLGDFYVALLPHFTDPARKAEFSRGETYAAGYVTCYFPAMEGLVKLSSLTGDKKYLDAAAKMAAFYKDFDRLPIDHAHGMLCNQVALLLLFKATKEQDYLDRVETRWDELVQGGYVNPAGGILEKCRVTFKRDEGCALADWFRLNLELGRVTGKARYWAMAERTLHNHFLQNQTPNGGFGHRDVLCDAAGAYGFGKRNQEATWCCSSHGQIAFINLRAQVVDLAEEAVTLRFALDLTAKKGAGSVMSKVQPGTAEGQVLRQHVRLEGMSARVIRVRQPHWADAVSAVTSDGTVLPLAGKDGFFATTQPVEEAEFIFSGGPYVEDRHCTRLPDGPVAGKPFVIGYGPKLMVAKGPKAPTPTWPATLEGLTSQGLTPLGPAHRRSNGTFVFGR